MNIQRYDPAVHDDRDEHGVNYFAEMEPDPSGEWVRFSDVHAVLAKFAAFADENGEPRKVLGEKPSVFDALRRLVSLAERLDDYAMGGNSVRDTLPNLVAEMNDAANRARLHL